MFAHYYSAAGVEESSASVSSPVNTLVIGPGNYRFGDFVRVGVPFTLLVMVFSVVAVPVLFPF